MPNHEFITFLISKRLFDDIMLSIIVCQGINLSSHQPVLLTLNSKCADRCVVTDGMAESDNKHAWCILHMASGQLNNFKERLGGRVFNSMIFEFT